MTSDHGLSQRQREDVALCAMTMAWCAGLKWAELPTSAPDGRPWEHDQEAFIQTALDAWHFDYKAEVERVRDSERYADVW